ncbi:cyclase family protein [Winogradskyella bathintestinalis]|uniref:Cyclase family protein n=1 Tax=Winogradskyella bathintestinalis TaxID=3035208 RepID=A0ABT7ZQG9_9FLAO|nr:cyclase family protein [Winogradskyella bathintestinalis]MDN3491257.1 cyclase family protein [Winogradskyella bathintestinalis]
MIATIQYKSRKLKIDLTQPLDISIPIKGGDSNVNAWYIDPPKIEPEEFDGEHVSVSEGAVVNFNTITFNPHSHGTHTETVGHIIKEKHSIHKRLKQFFFLAEVISVAPEKFMDDHVISAKQLQFAIGNKKRDALIVRTMPNMKDKKSKHYSHSNWTYFTEDAIKLLIKKGIKHLLIDMPSVDREEDGGELKAHKAFWNVGGKLRTDATITELIYVPNKVEDGMYMLDLHIAPFENDASPSKPILYKILD